MDREKVIRAIECCTNKVCIYTDTEKECPYWEMCDKYFEDCTTALAKDALALLKAQEPRVMTLEELADWHKKPESEREPIYVEYLPNSGLGTSKWTIEYFGFNPNLYPNKNSGYYGKWLRCWTSRPTLEQMEATPWQ